LKSARVRVGLWLAGWPGQFLFAFPVLGPSSALPFMGRRDKIRYYYYYYSLTFCLFIKRFRFKPVVCLLRRKSNPSSPLLFLFLLGLFIGYLHCIHRWRLAGREIPHLLGVEGEKNRKPNGWN
jgi:hypothetical protein